MLCGMGPPYYSLLIGGHGNGWLESPYLFLIAVSLCTCRRSNEEYSFINYFWGSAHQGYGGNFMTAIGI